MPTVAAITSGQCSRHSATRRDRDSSGWRDRLASVTSPPLNLLACAARVQIPPCNSAPIPCRISLEARNKEQNSLSFNSDFAPPIGGDDADYLRIRTD